MTHLHMYLHKIQAYKLFLFFEGLSVWSLSACINIVLINVFCTLCNASYRLRTKMWRTKTAYRAIPYSMTRWILHALSLPRVSLLLNVSGSFDLTHFCCTLYIFFLILNMTKSLKRTVFRKRQYPHQYASFWNRAGTC